MIVLLWTLVSSPIAVQNPQVEWRRDVADALALYDARALKLEPGWGAINYRLTRAGRHVDAGFFGYGLGDVFADDPRALAQARKFQAMRWAGLGMGLLAAGAAGAALFCGQIVPPNDRHFMRDLVLLNDGGLVAAVMLALGSNAAIVFAPMFLSKAVAFANADGIGIQVGGRF
jgi:hypothetical protein